MNEEEETNHKRWMRRGGGRVGGRGNGGVGRRDGGVELRRDEVGGMLVDEEKNES